MDFSNFPPELETLITNLLSENKCACHIINPYRTRILMWQQVKNGKTTFYLRIGIQKFISHEQTDRNGEIYWRYYGYEKSSESTPNLENNLTEVNKFKQRQNKTEQINHERKSVENHSHAT